jgi:hypothetical protein
MNRSHGSLTSVQLSISGSIHVISDQKTTAIFTYIFNLILDFDHVKSVSVSEREITIYLSPKQMFAACRFIP